MEDIATFVEARQQPGERNAVQNGWNELPVPSERPSGERKRED
jgi:hypothetical protein